MSNEKWKMGKIFVVFLEYLNFDLSVQAKKKKKMWGNKKKDQRKFKNTIF